MVLYPIHFSIQISSNAQVEMSYGENTEELDLQDYEFRKCYTYQRY